MLFCDEGNLGPSHLGKIDLEKQCLAHTFKIVYANMDYAIEGDVMALEDFRHIGRLYLAALAINSTILDFKRRMGL